MGDDDNIGLSVHQWLGRVVFNPRSSHTKGLKHFFTRYMFASLSVNEILLPKYINFFTYFRDLLLRVKMAPSRLKRKNSVLFAFIYRLMSPAVCSRQCRRNSTRACVFAKTARSSASSASVIVFAGYCLLLASFSLCKTIFFD